MSWTVMFKTEEAYLTARPLTDIECRVIIAGKLYQKENRVGPTWGWLRTHTDLSSSEFENLMWGLRHRRLIGFRRGQTRSTYVPKRAVSAVLRQQREQTSGK